MNFETLEDRSVPANFTPGNLAVLQSDTQTSAAASISIVEYNTAAPGQSPVQTLAIPSTGTNALTQSGSATSEGSITRTENGSYLLLVGYNANAGTLTVASGSAARVVGRVAWDATIDTTTRAPGYSANNIRSAASADGTTLYVGGAGSTGGLTTLTFGTQPSSPTQINNLNSRMVGVFGGQLYDSTGSGTTGLYKVGSGLPTSSAATTLLQAGGANNQNYFFLDRDPSVPGVDELFLVDGPTGAAIKKYSFDGTSWTLRGSITGTFFGLAIAANVSGGTDIYATTGTGAGSANNLVKYTDTAAYNAAGVFSTQTILATAPTGKAFRGVTFTPEQPNQPPTLTHNTGLADVTYGTTATITSSKLQVSDADNTAAQLTYTLGAVPVGTLTKTGFGVLSGGNTFTQQDIDLGNITYTAPFTGASDSFSFTVSDGEGGTIGSTTFSIDLNAAPTLFANEYILINPAESITIGDALLKYTDADNLDSELVYTVVTGPAFGTLTKNGVPITSFTQADLAAGEAFASSIRYTANSDLTGGEVDSIELSLTDGIAAPISVTIAIYATAITQPVSFTGDTTESFDFPPPFTNFPADGSSVPEYIVTPFGWLISESGVDASANMGYDSGTQNVGNTYFYGAPGNTERAMGLLTSPTNSTIHFGVMLTNVTHNNISSITVSFTGEQWRNGGGALDRLSFSYSENATSLTDGVYIPVTELDFVALDHGSVGALDGNDPANQTALSFTISGINWPEDATIFLRWTGIDESGEGDGLAIDDLSIVTANNGPVITANVGLTIDIGATAEIGNTLLNATDAEQSPAQVVYTVTSVPASGNLLRNGVVLNVNDTFTQEDIDNHLLAFAAGNSATVVSFYFNISDGQGGTTSGAFAIVIASTANQDPTDITMSSTSVDENLPSGSLVGVFSTVDPNLGDTFSYELLPESDDFATFYISGDELRTNDTFNFETRTVYSIIVRTDDHRGGLFVKTITITVSNVNETPTSLSLGNAAIDENAGPNAVIGTLSATDTDGIDTFAYSVPAGIEDNDYFDTVNDKLVARASLDFETKSSYNVTVVVTDAGGLAISQHFTISVLNVNDPPHDISLTNQSINENSFDPFIGTLSASDQDPNESFSFSLPAGVDDNAMFLLSGSSLQAAGPFDFEAKNSYLVTIRVADSNGGTFEKQLTIAVNNVNEQPTDITLSSGSVPENSPVGTLIATLSAVDPDTGDTFVFSLPSDTANNNLFTLVGNSLQTNTDLNFETLASYTIFVEVHDLAGLTYSRSLVITVTDVAEAPTDIALSGQSIQENAGVDFVIGALSATDEDQGETFAFSLDPLVDNNNLFNINPATSELRANGSFDYEIHSSYTVTVTVTDSGLMTRQKSFTIQVTNKNEAPTAIGLSNATLAENLPPGAAIGILTPSDPDAGDIVSLTLPAGEGQNDKFRINGTVLESDVAFDFEAQSSYTIVVLATDAGGLTHEETFVITVTDENDPPTNIALTNSSVLENGPSNALIGIVSAIDPDGTPVTYSLPAGAGDNSAFSLVNDNELRANDPLDRESKPTYTVVIRATSDGQFTDKTFIINVDNVNEPPTDLFLNGLTIAENAPINTVIGAFSTTDPDLGDTLEYTLIPGMGSNALFNVDGNSLRTSTSFNFEGTTTYTIFVMVTDSGGETFDTSFEITVTNVNEAPDDITLSNQTLPENAGDDYLIGTLGAHDPDANDLIFGFTLPNGVDDNALFHIVGGSLYANTSLDFETRATYFVTVLAADAGGLSFPKQLTITLSDVNDAPTHVFLTNASVPENAGANAVVGDLSATDPDAGVTTFTFTLPASLGNNDLFNIDNNLTLRANGSFDRETQSTYTVVVRVSDGFLTYDESIFITVDNVNEAPTDVTLLGTSIPENSIAHAQVGLLGAIDVDAGDTFTYTLPGGVLNNDLFEIDVNTNVLRAKAGFDFESLASYLVTVRATDSGLLWVEKTFSITVTDVNEAPTDIALTGNTLAENAGADVSIGTLSATDPDAGDTNFVFSLPNVPGSDNALFNIAPVVGIPTLRSNGSLNFEARATYNIVVLVTNGSVSFQKPFVINVTNVNEAPTSVALTPSSILENASPNTDVGTLSATDPDAGDTFTFTLASGGDNAFFTIVGNTTLQAIGSFDRETKPSYSITVHVVDADGLAFDQALTVLVANVNETPTDLSLSNDTIPENAVANTSVGILSATDPDAGDTFTFTLPSSGVSANDNSLFNIAPDGFTLRTNGPLNFETQSIYHLIVRVKDAAGLTFDKPITIHVSDVNDAPTDITLSNASIAENSAANTVVGTLSGTDPDASSTLTFSLLSGGDNAFFNISGTSLRATAGFDFETKASYTVTVRVSDGSLTFDKPFVVTVTNVNEAPTNVTLSNAAIAENAAANTVVGTLTGTDPDASSTLTFSLLSGGDNAFFNISGTSLRATAGFDFETQTSYTVTVRVSDGSLTFDKPFIITVTNVNEAPTNITLSNAVIAENSAANTVVGTLAGVDPDASSTLTFSLLSGGDNAFFNINGTSLRATAALNFETQASYTVTVRVSDGSLTFDKPFTITVTNVNEAPTNVTISNSSIAENAGVNAVIGTLTGTDPDAGSTLTFSLPAIGDNSLFNLSGATLRANASLDFETKSSYSVTVRVSDGALTFDKILTINVTNVNELTQNEEYVYQLYNDILFRDPEATALAAWVNYINTTGDRTIVSRGVLTSTEAAAIEIRNYYQDYLGRPADQGGVDGFISAYLSGVSLETIKYLILSSDEYYVNKGLGTNTGFLNALYLDVLFRPIDPVGAAGWGAQLDAGRPRVEVCRDSVTSTEGHTLLVAGWYQTYLNRALDPVSAGWVQVLDKGGDYVTILVGILASDEYYNNLI